MLNSSALKPRINNTKTLISFHMIRHHERWRPVKLTLQKKYWVLENSNTLGGQIFTSGFNESEIFFEKKNCPWTFAVFFRALAKCKQNSALIALRMRRRYRGKVWQLLLNSNTAAKIQKCGHSPARPTLKISWTTAAWWARNFADLNVLFLDWERECDLKTWVTSIASHDRKWTKTRSRSLKNTCVSKRAMFLFPPRINLRGWF